MASSSCLGPVTALPYVAAKTRSEARAGRHPELVYLAAPWRGIGTTRSARPVPSSSCTRRPPPRATRMTEVGLLEKQLRHHGYRFLRRRCLHVHAGSSGPSPDGSPTRSVRGTRSRGRTARQHFHGPTRRRRCRKPVPGVVSLAATRMPSAIPPRSYGGAIDAVPGASSSNSGASAGVSTPKATSAATAAASDASVARPAVALPRKHSEHAGRPPGREPPRRAPARSRGAASRSSTRSSPCDAPG